MPEPYFTRFADALRSGTGPATDPDFAAIAAADGFAVYRNNVVRTAIEALRAAYPAIERLVGTDAFTELARRYWQAHPPDRPMLILYGERLADFLADAPALGHLPWLADVARHDRAWLEAHHAAEAEALGAARAAALPPATLAALAPGLHPSVRLIRSGWPAFAIWHRNRIEPDTRPMRAEPGEYFSLIWRHKGTVRARALEAGDHALLARLQAGASLSEASAAAMDADPDFDPATAFGMLLGEALLRESLT